MATGINNSEALPVIDKHWSGACRVVFGKEIGPIMPYVPWLTSYNLPMSHKKSTFSGKPISYIITEYAPNSKWIDFGEIDLDKKYPPLSINSIKDIDSISEALCDRAAYAGNLVLGNSKYVERSSAVTDCFYMHETGQIADSKYIGFSTLGRFGEDCFGCHGIGNSQFTIRCYETNNDKRCFETWMSQFSSDCYYSYGLNNCEECMFSFHLRSRRNCIGNLEIEPSKYRQIKSKLLSELSEKLMHDKRLPSLPELANTPPMEKAALARSIGAASNHAAAQKPDTRAVEAAFSSAFEIILGKKPSGRLQDYSAWLEKHTNPLEKCQSAASGTSVFIGDYCALFKLPRQRLLTIEEGMLLGENAKLPKQSAESINLSDASKTISPIAYFSPEYSVGSVSNCPECPTAHDSSDCFRVHPCVYAKLCAYSFWPRSSSHAFGCAAALSCEFCINCYYSVKLKRCFEADSCRDCSDLYFCHNVENCQNCMFCFNVKNRQYAVGNVEVGREEFARVKKILLSSIVPSIERDKTLGIDIYNIGAGKHAGI